MAKDKLLEDMRKSVREALAEFSANRTRLQEEAFAKGGITELNKVVDEYNMLLAADFELINKEFQVNDPAYETLTKEVTALSEDLKSETAKVGKYAEVLSKTAKVIDLIGRIIIKLSV